MSNDPTNDSPKGQGDTATRSPNGIRIDATGELDELEADIADKRARMAASLGELRRRVDHVTSWRHWAGTYPVIWVAAGLSLGFITGLGGASRRR
jgi:hypothetical protein